MAMVKNTMKVNSSNPIDMIINAFRFGYMQGSKATKAYINKQKERK